MATAGAYVGRIAEVAISNAASSDVTTATYVAVEKVNSPRMPNSTDTAESSSNDSAGEKEYLATWKSGTASLEMIGDENATGQEHFWTAYLAGEIRAFRFRPRGDVSGDKQYRFLGIITSIEQSSDKGDVAKYSVTIQRTAAVTRGNQ